MSNADEKVGAAEQEKSNTNIWDVDWTGCGCILAIFLLLAFMVVMNNYEGVVQIIKAIKQ